MKSLSKKEDKNISIGKSTLIFIKNKILKLYPYIIASFLLGCILLYKENLLLDRIIFQNEFILEILQLGILGTGFPINIATWYISSMLVALFVLYPLAKKFKDNYITLIVPLLLIFFTLFVLSFQINVNDPITKTLFFMM